MISIQEAYANALKVAGVKIIYGVGAVPAHGFFNACAIAGIRVIGMRSQSSAVMCAGYSNYLHGEAIALVVLTPGPGTTHAISGISVCYDNNWPVMVIGFRISDPSSFVGVFQELDHFSILSSITKRRVYISSEQEFYAQLLLLKIGGVPEELGPSYIEIERSLLSQNASSNYGEIKPTMHRNEVCPIGSIEVKRLAEDLLCSKNPLFILGSKIRWHSTYIAIERIIKKYRFNFVNAPLVRGLISDSIPGNQTKNSMLAESKADLVVVIGQDIDWVLQFGATINRRSTVWHVNRFSEAENCGRIYDHIPNMIVVDVPIAEAIHQLEDYLECHSRWYLEYIQALIGIIVMRIDLCLKYLNIRMRKTQLRMEAFQPCNSSQRFFQFHCLRNVGLSWTVTCP